MIFEMKMEKKVKCKFCNYDWVSKSKLNFVTCPNCQRKTKKYLNNEK